MKLRNAQMIVIISVLLAACNMTLAQDVTPPPGYVAPTPVPTHGPVFPIKAPDLKNGAVLYEEKCAACHGETGLGDGPQGQQLPVSVSPLAVSELAWEAAPADWFLVVTLGNIENFMPPFASLTDQERWDVVTYSQSLSTTPEQISQGKELYDEKCSDCPTDIFRDQKKMAALSINELGVLLAEGGGGLPPLGESFSKVELDMVAVYLRSLTTSTTTSISDSAIPGESPEPAQTMMPSTALGTETPSADEASIDSEQDESVLESEGFGLVRGKLVNGSGGDLPSDLTVTLLGFQHSTEAGSMPAEVVNETVNTDKSGTYLFEEIDFSEGQIFLVETDFQGISFNSKPVFSEAGMTELSIPDLTLYESTSDPGVLLVEQLHVSFDITEDGNMQVFELFTISNLSNEAYVFSTDGNSLPFIPLPLESTNAGLELSQDSAPILTAKDGFVILPSQDLYSILAFFNLPYDKALAMNQPLALPVGSMVVIVPEDLKVESNQLADEGIQSTEAGQNVRMYTGGDLNSGTTLEIELSGKPKSATSFAFSDGNQQTLWISAGILGGVLIVTGTWLFVRDRSMDEDGLEDKDDTFESAEEVIDAIIALDDLHRAKKITNEAYQARREQLKARLKELL